MSHPYLKKPLSIADQIALLESRGLVIKDKSQAEHFLSFVSYYRLTGYWWTLQSNSTAHKFNPGTTFETVIDIYNFDRELRLFTFDGLERFEIALRTILVHEMSMSHGPFWYSDFQYFINRSYFDENILKIEDELNRSKEEKEKNVIAHKLGLPNYVYLESWIQSLSILRNNIAHHSRIWNRSDSFAPKKLQTSPYSWIKLQPLNDHLARLLYNKLCALKFLLNQVSPGNHFADKLRALIRKYPVIDISRMGFPKGWDNEDLWYSV